jgi:uncharacterized membrane protein YfcA
MMDLYKIIYPLCNNMLDIFLTIVIGILAGLSGGALGQSGAEIMLPGLLILNIVPDFKTAAGTVLLAILPPISLLAVLEYYKRGQVKICISFVLFITYFFTAFIGAYMTKNISNNILEYITGFYFLIISMFFFWNAYTGTYGESLNGKKTVTHLANGFRNLIK